MYPGQATFSGSMGTMNSGGLSNSGSVCSGISGSAAAQQRIQLAPIAGTAQRDMQSQKQEIWSGPDNHLWKDRAEPNARNLESADVGGIIVSGWSTDAALVVLFSYFSLATGNT